MKLSIIIPVYNEERTIRRVLKKVSEVKLPNSTKLEIIVVNDGSNDKTEKILSSTRSNNFKYFRHQTNLGKGAAIRTGMESSTGDFIIIQDADLEYNPQDYTKLIAPILEGSAEVVYGTRLKNYPLNLWGNKKTVLPIHLIANRFLTMLTNILYGGNLTDMETGFKIFKRKIFDNIIIKSDKFDFEAEITAKLLKNNISIVEVPITVKPRTYKEGKKIGWRDGLVAIWTLIKYRFVD